MLHLLPKWQKLNAKIKSTAQGLFRKDTGVKPGGKGVPPLFQMMQEVCIDPKKCGSVNLTLFMQ